jgi:competence protein ComEC
LTWLAAAAAFVAAGAFARERIPARRGGAWPGVRRPPLHRLAGAAAAVAVLLAGPATLRPRGGGLEIHAIDVGQGDAFAIRSPAGHWIVVDAGPRSADFDAGRARVVPFLLRHGVRRIDALILTHPHADHIGGALALLDAFDIGAIIDPAIPAEQELYASTLARARGSATRWLAAREGRELRFGDATIRFLAPLEDVLDDATDPNDFSVVFRLGWGRFGALFLGDAPARVENELVARHGTALSAQVLKVGHHGSRTSTGDSLLAAVQPRLALVAVGRRNRYGHPDPGVLARLDRHDIRVLRTEERGHVTVRGEPGGELTVIVTR